MDIELKFDCTGVNWKNVAATLKAVQMGYYAPEVHQKAFKNSTVTVFAYQSDQLIGFGRAISDGAYQAAVYDMAVNPQCQGRKIGSLILKNILERLPDCNVILYAAPGKELFYQKHQFRKLKTGMALFLNPEQKKKSGFTE